MLSIILPFGPTWLIFTSFGTSYNGELRQRSLHSSFEKVTIKTYPSFWTQQENKPLKAKQD